MSSIELTEYARGEGKNETNPAPGAKRLRRACLAVKRPTRPTGLGMLEISEAGSAWPSTAASDRGLGRPVARRGRAPIKGCKA
jgi:hypothetical protein